MPGAIRGFLGCVRPGFIPSVGEYQRHEEASQLPTAPRFRGARPRGNDRAAGPSNELGTSGKVCLLRLLFDDLLVLFGREEVGFVCGAEPDDPALAVGVLVDVLGRIFEGGVDLDDLAANRHVQV